MATIHFRGQQREVPYIGARQLVRIASAMHELAQVTGIGSADGVAAIRAQEYPVLILRGLQGMLQQLETHQGTLTRAEELFYGTLGRLMVPACSADEVADAPMDELVALCTTVWEQEAQTQTGKQLMATLARFGQPNTPNTPTADGSASPSDTTSTTTPPTSRKRTGTAKAG